MPYLKFGDFEEISNLCRIILKNTNMVANIKYLDPKADLTFKKIFSNHPDLQISLLNVLLPLEEDQHTEHRVSSYRADSCGSNP